MARWIVGVALGIIIHQHTGVRAPEAPGATGIHLSAVWAVVGSSRPWGWQEFSTVLSPTLLNLLQAGSPWVQPSGGDRGQIIRVMLPGAVP